MEAVTHTEPLGFSAAPMAFQRAGLGHSDYTFKRALNFLIPSLLTKFNGRAVGLLLPWNHYSLMFEELKYFKQLLSAGSTDPFGLAKLSLGVKTKTALRKWSLPGLKSSRSQVLFLCFYSPIRLREEFSAFSKATWLFPRTKPTSICKGRGRK